jgi:hypothetical protein
MDTMDLSFALYFHLQKLWRIASKLSYAVLMTLIFSAKITLDLLSDGILMKKLAFPGSREVIWV